MDLADLRVHIGADTADAEAGLQRLHAGVNGLTQSIAAGFGAGVGFGIFEEGIRAIGAALQDTLGAWGEFQRQMVQTGALTHMGTANIQEMEQAIIEMSQRVPVSAQQLAQGLYFVASAGLQGENAMHVLEVAADASAVGLGNMNSVTQILVSTMNAYHLGASQAADITDKMAVAITEGHIQADQLVSGLGRVLPLAAAVGLSFDQVMASVATMSREGMKAQEAYTALRAIIQAIVAPTSQAAQVMAQYGISSGELAATLQGPQGLAGALDLIFQKTNGNLSAIREIIPNIRAETGAVALNATQHETYGLILEAETNSHGKAAAALEQLSHTYDFQSKIFTNNLQAMGLGIGQFLGNAMTPLLETANTLLPAATSIAGDALKGLEGHFSGLGQAWTQSLSQLKAGDIEGAFNTLVIGVETQLKSLIDDVGKFGESMFGAGFNLVEQLGGGMMNAATSILQAVINTIANIISSFFIGFSPPSQGPLSRIAIGGTNLMQTYADGMRAGVSDSTMGEIAGNIGDYFIGSSPPKKGPLVSIQVGGMNTMKAFTDGLKNGTSDLPDIIQSNISDPLEKYIGNAVTSSAESISGLKQDIAGLGTAADEIQANIDGIKDHFKDALDDANNRLKDLDQSFQNVGLDMQIAQEQVEAMRLGVDIEKTKGDPRERAQIDAQIQVLQLDKDRQSNLVQIAELGNKVTKTHEQWTDALGKVHTATQTVNSDEAAVSAAKKAQASDQGQILALKEKEYAMTDHAKLAELIGQKAITDEQLKTDEAAKSYQAAVLKVTELPIKNEIEGIKRAQQDAIAPLQRQLDIYNEQKKVLTDIQKQLDAQKGAGGGGGGGGIKVPPGGNVETFDPNKKLNDMIEGAKKEMQKKGEELGKALVAGGSKFVSDHLGGEIGAAIGAGIGLATLGPIGIPIGGALGGYIGQGVQEKLKSMNFNFQPFVASVQKSFSDANTAAQPYLKELGDSANTWGGRIETFWKAHGDQVEAATQATWDHTTTLMKDQLNVGAGLVKVGADVISGNWTKAGEDIKKEGSDVWTYVSDVSLKPAMGLLQATVGTAMSALGTTVDAGTKTLKSGWDTAMGGLHDTAKAQWDKIPPDIQSDLILIGSTLVQRTGEWFATWTGHLGQLNEHSIAFWSQQITDWTKWGSDILDGVDKWTGEQLGKLEKWFGDQAAKFKAWLTPLKTDGGDIGNAIIDGLADALGDVGGKVSDAAGALARKAIKGAKDALGIGSPSKEFVTVGGQVIDGLIQGLGDNLGKLQDFLKGVMSDLLNKAKEAGKAAAGAVGEVAGKALDALQPGKVGYNSAGQQTGDPTKVDPFFSAPHYAGGGLVRQPTFAVVGEAGPEIIIPLRDLARTDMGGGTTSNTVNIYVQAPVYGVDHLQDVIIKSLVEAHRRGRITQAVISGA